MPTQPGVLDNSLKHSYLNSAYGSYRHSRLATLERNRLCPLWPAQCPTNCKKWVPTCVQQLLFDPCQCSLLFYNFHISRRIDCALLVLWLKFNSKETMEKNQVLYMYFYLDRFILLIAVFILFKIMSVTQDFKGYHDDSISLFEKHHGFPGSRPCFE